jgi:proteasome lid subunit RPN8/RPN11
LGDFGAESKDEALSVYIASSLLGELREEAGSCLERERANILTGYVAATEEGGAAVIAVNRIAAEVDTTSSAVHFSFSPLTFDSVRQELARRKDGQIIVGWAHHHPVPCGRDCLMTVPACKTENVFFSIADRTVHRSGFAAPYMVAFVAGKGAYRRADDPLIRAYAWRDGLIRESAFRTI